MVSGFSSLALSSDLTSVVAELGYDEPTPVQAAAIPPLLAGCDLIGQSKTGSGKTAAFTLPCLQRLELFRRVLQVLILCPTRELSSQVAREVRRLGRRHPGLAVLEVVGGQPIRGQLEALERGVHVVVGTPGRLLDHLSRGTLGLEAVTTVVLDEADRMLDMGFGEDVERILREAPRTRQTVLFSATFPPAIEALTRRHMGSAERVTIDAPGEATLAIRQARLVVEGDGRFGALCWVLDRFSHESALVFCNYKESVRDVVGRLTGAGVSAARLDGDMDQFHRDQAMARFRNRSLRVLVATDVAGRGLDVEGLDLVVNYELPAQSEIYVHRIGRTGRAGERGVAVSLNTARQEERIVGIERLTGAPMEVLERDPGQDPGPRALLARLQGPAPMHTVLISGGRKDKLRPGDIVGALTGEAGGLDGARIGKIEVHDHIAYVAVAREQAEHAVEQLRRGRIKGRSFRAKLVPGHERGR